MRFVLLLLVWLCAFDLVSANGITTESDSLGLEVKGDTTFVRHQVSKKETLYGLSRRYHSTVAAIVASNPEVKDGLAVGEILRVPYGIDHLGKVHRVARGETLYSIALYYQLEVDQLIAWNKLQSHELSVGQELKLSGDAYQAKDPPSVSRIPGITYHTVTLSETLYAIARKYDVTVEQLKEWNNLSSNELQPGQHIAVTNRDSEGKTEEVETNQVEATTNQSAAPRPALNKAPISNGVVTKPVAGKMKKEKGIAEVIQGDYGSKKYLALHRTASVGTIMQVKNEMNNLSIFVRVIGQLPNTGNNQNLILKISKAAQERLGAIDDQFRVEVSYIP